MKTPKMPARNKGFLGPIGDDLPSLIPLLFALLIFFYVFTFTWNAFDQKSRSFNDALAILRVGNTLKGNNYVSGIETFDERCNEAQSIKRIKFMAGLVPLSTGPGQTFPGIDIETLESGFLELNNQKFMCTNISLPQEAPQPTSQDMMIRSFPVALEFKNEATNAFYIRPTLLVVVTWR